MKSLLLSAIAMVLAFSSLPVFGADRRCDMKKRLKFAYFSPSGPGNTYWPQVFEVINEVARDLDFDFVHYDLGMDNRMAIKDAVAQRLASADRPDAIIITLPAGNTQRILEIAEKEKVPVIIHGPLFPQELPAIGSGPRAKFKSWITYFKRSDAEAGYQLAKELIRRADAAKTYNRDGKIEIIGMSGLKSWYGSSLREEGLLRAIGENPRAVLNQILSTDLSEKVGLQKSLKALKRFPSTSVIWGASDQIASAAADAFTASGKILGTNAFTGGIDLSEKGLQNIIDGKLEASVASPMYSMSEMMVYLFDYMHGLDFASDVGLMPLTELVMATRENVREIVANASIADSIDFRRLSKCYNKSLKNYDFSLKALKGSLVKP